MKKLLVGLCAVFICTFAIAHTINWHVGDQIISTTTCNSGDTITPPTVPSKRGYHFKNWARYIQLEYIEGTGTQYLNIGNPFASSTNKIEASIAFSIILNGKYAFGAMEHSPYVGFFISDSGKHDLGFVNSEILSATRTDIIPLTDTVYNITMYNSSTLSYYEINNQTGSLRKRDIPQSDMILFGINYNKLDLEPLKMYYFKTYDSDILTRNLIPAKRVSDNAIGMYDTVTDTFFTNQGTGDFIAGPEVGGL